MISRVSVAYFKNFSSELAIVLSDPTDGYYFDVVVGRNGSGKSCLLESIEWCLCNRPSRELRAPSLKGLVNVSSPDGGMSVRVELVRGAHGGDGQMERLSVRRSFNGRMTKLTGVYTTAEAQRQVTPDEVPGLLAYFGLLPARINGIRVKQNQSQVACRAPLELLMFIETMCGLDEQKRIIEVNEAKIGEASQAINGWSTEIQVLHCRMSELAPVVADINRCYSELYRLLIAQARALNQKLALLQAERLKCLEAIDTAHCAEAAVSAEMEMSLGQLTMAEAEKASLSEVMRHAQDQMDSIQSMYKKLGKKKRNLEKSIADKESDFEDLSQQLSESIEQSGKIQEKIASDAETLVAFKCGASESKNFICTFESLISSHTLSAECLTACESFWANTRTLEEAKPLRNEIENRIDGFNSYELKRNEIRKKNASVAEKSQEINLTVSVNVAKKRKLSVDMVDIKLNIRRLKQRLGQLRSEQAVVVAGLAELADMKGYSNSATELESFTQLLKGENKDVVGMLLHIASPVSAQYGIALLTVLGKKARSTIVVRTRDCAVLVANAVKDACLSCSSILIVDELDRCAKASNNIDTNGKIVPLSSVVKYRSDVAEVVFSNKLSNWYLFLGNGSDFTSDQRFCKDDSNVVCLDGCQFLADGEISLTFSKCPSGPSKGGISTGWPPESTGFDESPTLQLQSDIEKLNCEITSLEPELVSATALWQKMEEEWRGAESGVSSAMKTIEKLKKELQNEPKRPIGNIADCNQELNRLRMLSENVIDAKSRIHNIVGDELFSGVKIISLVSNILEHRRKFLSCKTEMRVLEKDINSSKVLLVNISECEANVNAKMSLIRKRSNLNEIALTEVKESLSMLCEESCSRAGALTRQRELFELSSVSIKTIREKIRLEQKKLKQFELAATTAEKEIRIHEEAEVEAINMLDLAEGNVQRIEQIGVSVNSMDNITCLDPINIRQISKYITDVSLQVDFFLAKEQELDVSVLSTVRRHEEAVAKNNSDIDMRRVCIRVLHGEILEASATRYQIISNALASINATIGIFYDRLIGAGECYLSYPSDSTSLFSEGISLIARSTDHCWTDINKLSGGQQAACGLALLVSFQDVFPSPVYILDEVDAALDTRTAFRLGQLLKLRSLEKGTQFIVVSHHPELQLSASKIVGLYHVNGEVASVSTRQI